MLVSSEALDFRRHNSPHSEGEYGATGIFAVGLCDCQINMNKEMMFRVLLVLMFGPDTGPLLLLPSQFEFGL